MFHGVTKEQVVSLYRLTGDYILLDKPSLTFESGNGEKAVLKMDIGVSAETELIAQDAAGGESLFTKSLLPGKIARVSEEIRLSGEAEAVTVVLRNAAGDQVISQLPVELP